MGGNHSNLVPMPFGFDYMTISVRNIDTLRLFYATDQEISIIREMLQKHSKGIKREKERLGSGYEFQLKGYPFYECVAAADINEGCKLVCHLLHGLYNHGLKLLVSTNVSQSADRATWLFHREQTIAMQLPFACICASELDKLYFINFPQNLHSFLQDVVEKHWQQKVKNSKVIEDTLRIKLKGDPWIGMGLAQQVQTKTLIKALLNELEMCQWILYGASNFLGNVDTLVFRYDSSFFSGATGSNGLIISVNDGDNLHFIDAPPESIDCARNIIRQFWKRGIKSADQNLYAFEFRMKGSPWWTDGEIAVDSRLLICKLLEGLMKIGWRVRVAIDLSMSLSDKTALIFQRCTPMSPSVFCVSLSETNRVRIINAPRDIVEAISAEIKRVWLLGVLKQGVYGAGFEVKLKGSPWSFGFSGHDGAHGRVLLKYIVKICATMGCFIVFSADICAHMLKGEIRKDYFIDAHSLWFMQMGEAAPAPQAVTDMPLPTHTFGMQEQPSATFGF